MSAGEIVQITNKSVTGLGKCIVGETSLVPHSVGLEM